MDARKLYEFWLNDPYFDEETKQELRAIEDDAAEIEERFYRNLEFGTGGLRGIIGAGTNRMNLYTVRRATQGLANYILSGLGKLLYREKNSGFCVSDLEKKQTEKQRA